MGLTGTCSSGHHNQCPGYYRMAHLCECPCHRPKPDPDPDPEPAPTNGYPTLGPLEGEAE